MRRFLLGLLLIIMFSSALADDAKVVATAPVPAPTVTHTGFFHKIKKVFSKKPTHKPGDLSDLSSLGAANIADPLVPTAVPTATSPINHPEAPKAVDPAIAQETEGMFHGAQENLNLYVTQIQCQATGINTNTCNNLNTTNTGSNVMSNVNKFLLNSVTSSLGIGVQVHF